MFSKREEKIIHIIGRKSLTLEEISTALFKDVRDKPFDTVITTGNSVRRIIKKCEFHFLPWTLLKVRSEGVMKIRKENYDRK